MSAAWGARQLPSQGPGQVAVKLGMPGQGPSPGAEPTVQPPLLGSPFQTPNKVFKWQKLTEGLKTRIQIVLT